LALALLKGEFQPGDKIQVDVRDDPLIFERVQVDPPVLTVEG
jgi:hypothetical protein